MTDERSGDARGQPVTGLAPSSLRSPRPASNFLAGLIGTVASRGLLVGFGLLASVLVARSLGATGRGEFAVATALGAVGLQIANLGIHTSSSWSVSKNPGLLGQLIANGLLASVVAGGGLVVVFGAVFAALPAIAPLGGAILLLALASIPVGLANLVTLNLALGIGRVRLFNVMELGQRVFSTVAIVGLIVGGLISSTLAFASVVAASAASLLVGLVALNRNGTTVRRASLSLLRANAAYGLRAYVAALLTFLVLRLDVLILERLQGDRQVGEYAVAVSIAEFALLGPVTVATLLFPRLAAMTNSQARWMTASHWALLTGVATIAVMLVGLLEGANLIAWLYGLEFTGAAPALLWLLPGIVFLSVHTILMHYYYAIGTPAITIVAPFCGFVLNVALNLLLIPGFGIVGSALASTMAYGAMLVLTAGHFVLYAKPVAIGPTTTLDA